MTAAARHFLLAVQFFTRIPITGRLARWVGYSQPMLNASAGHFPGVGWLVGAASALVMALMLGLLPAGSLGALTAAILSTIASVWLTGGFHEDGLSDTADGLGGARERDRALEIMKDSRIGNYGALALGLALLLKVALLAGLATRGSAPAAAALIAAHVLSRFAPLVIMRSLPYVSATPTSKSKPLAEAVSAASFRAGCLWALPALLLLWFVDGGAHFAAALVLWGALLFWFHRLLRRRLGGFTGDTLGATQQVCELALYLGLAWV